MHLGPATPIFRIFDADRARDFYLRWLQFEVLFEHRFAADMPLYLGIRRGRFELHLSEHSGDTTPGTRIRVPVSDLDAFYHDLCSRPERSARPGKPCKQPWGERDMTITDPFGNKMTFYEVTP